MVNFVHLTVSTSTNFKYIHASGGNETRCEKTNMKWFTMLA